jgi:Trypsin-like peptidase domain
MQKAMALVTTPITIFCGDTLLGSATGFFFSSADQKRLFLITNRHVVVNDRPQPGQTGPQFPDRLVLRLHQNDNDLRQSENYVVPLYRTEEPRSKDQNPRKDELWREIDADTDVVAIELNITDLNRYSKATFLPANLLPADMPMPLGEALVVIGYPLGLSDQVFNLPIAREGTVASVVRHKQ